MAPSRSSRKRGQTRMDAALDAMAPIGFPSKLVRATVDQLLKVYGGNEGWVFIEEASYSLLLEALLEKQSVASKAQTQDGLIEDNTGDGHNEASPAGCSNGVLLPCTNTETSDAASVTNEAVGTVSAATETGNQLAIKVVDAVSAATETDNQLSMNAIDTVSAANETGNQLPIMAVDTVVSAATATGNQLPIKAMDTVSAANQTDCQPAGTTLAYSPPRTRSPGPVNGLCHRKRRHCHGWISSDDEQEELIQLPPASLPKVLSMLVHDRMN